VRLRRDVRDDLLAAAPHLDEYLHLLARRRCRPVAQDVLRGEATADRAVDRREVGRRAGLGVGSARRRGDISQGRGPEGRRTQADREDPDVVVAGEPFDPPRRGMGPRIGAVGQDDDRAAGELRRTERGECERDGVVDVRALRRARRPGETRREAAPIRRDRNDDASVTGEGHEADPFRSRDLTHEGTCGGEGVSNRCPAHAVRGVDHEHDAERLLRPPDRDERRVGHEPAVLADLDVRGPQRDAVREVDEEAALGEREPADRRHADDACGSRVRDREGRAGSRE